MREAHEKCVYCESKFKNVSKGQIDHVKPISKDTSTAFAWSNLVFTCPECNRIKNADYEHDAIINPFDVDPKNHLEVMGAHIAGKRGDRLGRTTVLVLDLNRAGLLESREEFLNQLEERVLLYDHLPPGLEKERTRLRIEKAKDASSKYSMIAREYFRRVKFPGKKSSSVNKDATLKSDS